MVTFTGLTLAVGDPFYEKIWQETELMIGGDVPEKGVGWLRGARDGLGLVGLGVRPRSCVFVIGLVPVIGPIVGPVLGVIVAAGCWPGSWCRAALEARGMDRAAQNALLADHRRTMLGFGAVVQLCFLMPFGAMLMMPAAVVGSTMLAREMLEAVAGAAQRGEHGCDRGGVGHRPPVQRVDEPGRDRVGDLDRGDRRPERAPGPAAGRARRRGRPRPARGGTRTPSDTCAIRGGRPVPSYIRCSHWRQMVPSGVAIQSTSSRSCGVTVAPAGERVVARHDQVGDVVGDAGARDVVGHGERHPAPAVHDPDVALTGRDQVDGVPRLALVEGQPQVGMGVEEPARDRRDQAAHRGRERDQADAAGHDVGAVLELGLELLEIGEDLLAGVDQVPTVAGQHHAAADPFQQRDADLPLEALDLLRDGARA